MADTLQFDLVAPERMMASGEASMVVVPGVEGDLGALPGHAPFLTTLRPGIVTATVGGKEERYIVFGGFAEIGPDRVTILADDVHRFEELKPHTLEERIADAEEELATAEHDDIVRWAQHLNDLHTLKQFHVS